MFCKKMYAISLCVLLISGCTAYQKESGEAVDTESSYNKSITINSSPMPSADKEIDVSKTKNAWGIDDIMELFDIWEWKPSSNPTSLEEIVDRAGYSRDYIEGRIKNATTTLTMLPKLKAGDSEIAFYTEESKKQFSSIEWDKYVFKEAKTNIFTSDSQGLWGYSYLCNSLQKQMDNRPAVFVSYYYIFETNRLEIIEIVEITEEIIDYACVLDYQDDVKKVFMRTEEGIRLLNPAAEINPYEEVLPTPKLKGKDLERYIALVFLDIARDSQKLNKYKKIFSDESFSLLQQMDCYYENPKEIYDLVVFRKNGNITVTSQFQPTLWGNILIDIDIWFAYDIETGKISVKEGKFRLSVKP